MATIDDVIDTDEFEPLEIESIDDEERNGLLQNTEVQAAPHSSQSCGMKELFISLISMAAISFILAVVITSKKDSTATDPSEEISLYPKALLQNVYHKVDFENKKHIIPPYWKDAEMKTFQEGALPHLGPCYLPKEEQDWLSLVEKNEQIRGKHNIKYRDGIKKRRDDSDNAKDLSGLCRPGFIIIGAGKCGTSSLYHYLVGHDRVLPAKNKQIHYFKYWKTYPMKWYLSNFPPAETFLSNGALMTGEASPGYLPYPDVAHIIGTWMQSHAGNGAMQPLVSPKIITIMRNPLERSWSSYNYNYRVPLLQKLRKKDSKAEAKYSSDEWYEKNKIFSFDELVKAELKLLKACLAPGGNAERSSSKRYSTKEWAAPIFERRQAKGLPGMISLDESCYGKRVSNAVPRRQWQELVEDQPHKEIDVENLHLVQSLVGRSIYVLPLEWWYALYPMKDLHVVCSEDLRYRASRTMSNVSDFLGLPSFDFTNITNAGIYNSGAHTGYDKITEWDKTVYVPDNIPISDELRKEYMDFLKPYNERLFQMTGQNCDWYEI